MQGQDKGLIPYQGKLLIQQVVERFAPQVTNLLVSANRHLDQYQALGYPVLSDAGAPYQGPLYGIQQGFKHATQPLLAVVPCDMPAIPLDLVARLQQVLDTMGCDLVYARSATHRHSLCCVCRTSLLSTLNDFI